MSLTIDSSSWENRSERKATVFVAVGKTRLKFFKRGKKEIYSSAKIFLKNKISYENRHFYGIMQKRGNGHLHY